MERLNFLHLTDLHLGVAGMRELWPRVERTLRDDLSFLIKEAGGLDLVCFTGDLTQQGRKEEFAQVGLFLARLWEHFGKLGQRPCLVAVPGNHDLVRPPEKDPVLLTLTRLWADPMVGPEFWSDPQSPYRHLIEDAFANYREWWEGLQLPRLPEGTAEAMLPGDFAVTFQKGELKIGILGLNTAFLQLKGDMDEGSLALNLRQFHAACGGNGPEWVQGHDACLLMTHHPASWLRPEARNDLEGEIHYPPESFALHLFGHMHEADLSALSVGGGSERRRLQGTALFSQEGWTKIDSRQRTCGYTLGSLSFDQAGAGLQLWPRKALRGAGRNWDIKVDHERFEIPKGGEATRIMPLRLPEKNAGSAGSPPPVGVRPAPAATRRKYAGLVGPANFREVHNLLAELLTKSDLQSPVRIKNIALDMEMTWALIRDDIMSRRWGKRLEWRTLMVDGRAKAITQLRNAGSLISPQMARARETEIGEFCDGKAQYIEEHNFGFACRVYAEAPLMHGFLVDDRILFVGLCSNDGKAWTTSPYIQFIRNPEKRSELDGDIARHFIQVFEGWFDAHWNAPAARRVWPHESIQAPPG
ncbi:hypothetical protein GPA19_01515 [Azoarcus indigens]|uniref:Calcineurin-like phosphoesterase family protein n=1 Tax=Azoarcus indigens TaxID=29545 RepID=A0A4R6EDA8_9RHOO|nr:metallophosphoesterase [Azoarcus indigens]NMG63630.1 hypothetical protein [Azoarcus indigens]TDN56165.1 calcineurin-like phosphoesterase family protein [Azoarcus indigens]